MLSATVHSLGGSALFALLFVALVLGAGSNSINARGLSDVFPQPAEHRSVGGVANLRGHHSRSDPRTG